MENLGVIELSSKELISIDAGINIFYEIGKVAGFISGTFTAFIGGVADGIEGTRENN